MDKGLIDSREISSQGEFMWWFQSSCKIDSQIGSFPQEKLNIKMCETATKL